tara:strand:+ start:4031 stop:4678 length:648 start_codon:yes stop_codon:yes gene_type:complete
MSTSISGSIRLTYGNHTHNETFSGTTTALSFTNQSHGYSAGEGRAVYHASTGVALYDIADELDGGHEGLLLIKNINTAGHLNVSMDAGTSFDVKLRAGEANLISVGPDHVVNIKTDVAPLTTQAVASVTSAGVITFGSAIATAGTYLMTATADPSYSSAGPLFIMKTTSDATTSGTVYELDGETTKDLATGPLFTTDTRVTLDYICDYRFTLTEA